MKNKLHMLLEKKWFANALSGCIIVLFYLIMSHLSDISVACHDMLGYFSTIIYGCTLAYVMHPLVVLFEKYVFRRVKQDRIRQYVSIFFSVLIVIVAFMVLIGILIPQLYSSIRMFLSNLDAYSVRFQAFIDTHLPSDVEQKSMFSSQDIMTELVGYISNNYTNILSASASTGKRIIEWIIAFVLSVYLLIERYNMKTGSKQLLHAILSNEVYDRIIQFIIYCNKVMSKYVILSMIDGLIVGTATAIFTLVCGMEYAGLIAIVIGVTNIVPTFGPIAGGVACGFILLMTNPVHAAMFVVFIVVLQFLDGYVIKPKLFGSNLGVSGLWILIFILLGGNVFGIAGILLAIPAATITDYMYHNMLLPRFEREKCCEVMISDDEDGGSL